MALGFYNPLQRLLDGTGGRDNLNVTGQPVRSPEGVINRPSPVYDRPAFTPAGAFNPMVYQGPSDRELMPAEMYLRGGIGGIG